MRCCTVALVAVVLTTGCVAPRPREGGADDFLLAAATGMVLGVDDHGGSFSGSVCDWAPGFRVDLSERWIHIYGMMAEHPNNTATRARLASTGLVVAAEVSFMDPESCGIPILVLTFAEGNGTLLELWDSSFRLEEAVGAEGDDVRIGSRSSLPVGGSVTIPIDVVGECGEGCHRPSDDHETHDVHYRGNITIQNHGWWSKEDVRYVDFADDLSWDGRVVA